MKKVTACILMGIITYGCNKKNNEDIGVLYTTSKAYTVKDYMPLKYGNYWVYELTITDTNNVIITNYSDSCYVNDSIFDHGKWFYWITGNTAVQGYLKDSLNYIISSNGKINLSYGTNEDTLANDSCNQLGIWNKLLIIMKTNPTSYSYNSKTYSNCINRYTYFSSNINSNCPNWNIYNTYAPGVGILYGKFGFTNSCNIWEIKLKRYKIN